MKSHTSGFLSIVNDAKSRVRECTVADVAAMQQENRAFHLIDVREESEWNNAHIQGAIHLGKGIIERDIESEIPAKDAEIVQAAEDLAKKVSDA